MVTCKTLTKAERYNIMEQAVAPCPEITMIIKGQKVRALLDMESQVTLMNESYYLQNIQHLLPTVDKDHLNAHKLFNPFTTALFVLFAFGAILYGWGSNTAGHYEVII